MEWDEEHEAGLEHYVSVRRAWWRRNGSIVLSSPIYRRKTSTLGEARRILRELVAGLRAMGWKCWGNGPYWCSKRLEAPWGSVEVLVEIVIEPFYLIDD